MSIRGIRRALSIRFTRAHLEREVDEELAYHVARRAEALEREGWSRDDALAEARRRFGDAASVREACVREDEPNLRREELMTFIDNVRTDIRLALRSLRRSPGFTIVALTTLILGIGSFGAIFSYFNAVYYARLPYHNADRMVALAQESRAGASEGFSSVSLDALTLLRTARSFDRVSAYSEEVSVQMVGTEPEQIRALRVDTAFVPMFDLRPEIGRLLTAEEIVGNASVAMISDVFWRNRFGADPRAVGKSIVIADRPRSIVGVLPVGFRFPYQTDVIVPLRAEPDSGATTHTTFVAAIAMLRSGVSRAQARAEVASLAKRLPLIDPTLRRPPRLFMRDEVLERRGYAFLPAPGLFLGAGLFLLLIASANVTNLFYVRAAERRGGMAIRGSLGASRWRLIRLALAESVVISILAAVAGTFLARALVLLWLHFIPTSGFPSWFRVVVDGRVVLFAIGVMVLVTLVVGLAPAREGTRIDLVTALKGMADHGVSGRKIARGSKRGLVLQLAMSVTLFIAATLLLRSFQHLTKVDVGYAADRIATINPIFFGKKYDDVTSRLRFAEDIAERSRVLPGSPTTAVRGYFTAMRTDIGDKKTTNNRYDPFLLVPDGDTRRAARASTPFRAFVVSDSYFKVLGLQIRTGRNFDATDVAGTESRVIVARTVASLLWGRTPAIGHTIQFGSMVRPARIIGVVDDVRDLEGGKNGYNGDAKPMVYFSTRQAVTYNPQILATGSGDVLAIRSEIVGLLRQSDPTLMLIPRQRTLADQFGEAFLVTRVFGGIIAAFAASALILSIIGIYGVVAFGITQRVREIGVRIALGGTTDDVVRLLTMEALRFVLVGLGIGLAFAAALGKVVRLFLFDVSPLDPLTYVGVAVVFGMVAMLASYLPARRAARVDPLIALRAS